MPAGQRNHAAIPCLQMRELGWCVPCDTGQIQVRLIVMSVPPSTRSDKLLVPARHPPGNNGPFVTYVPLERYYMQRCEMLSRCGNGDCMTSWNKRKQAESLNEELGNEGEMELHALPYICILKINPVENNPNKLLLLSSSFLWLMPRAMLMVFGEFLSRPPSVERVGCNTGYLWRWVDWESWSTLSLFPLSVHK